MAFLHLLSILAVTCILIDNIVFVRFATIGKLVGKDI